MADKTAALIDDEVRRLVEDAYRDAIRFLSAHKNELMPFPTCCSSTRTSTASRSAPDCRASPRRRAPGRVARRRSSRTSSPCRPLASPRVPPSRQPPGRR